MTRTIFAKSSLLIVLLIILIMPSIVYSAAGGLDTNFGGFSSDGRLGIGGMLARAMALQPDYKRVLEYLGR